MGNKAQVIIKGRYCPLWARSPWITPWWMWDLPVAIGDEVILLGSADGLEITADDWARHLGTINYEITCMLTSRVERVYI